MVGSDELCMMTAGEALAAFRARRLSPVELMQAVIARVEQVNPALNAFTYTFFERALEQARRAEAKYLKSDGRPRPLEGIPVAIKDLHPVKGEITTFGSKAFADNRPDHTAPTVERLLRAGAILHARTTTPESPSGTTYSALWGVTRNPWNTAYSPGGSSGGAGAALASGMTMLADGTDAGGSIRIPASACGLIGYKPPFGRNPLDREFPRETILQFGPLTRAVGDAALMQNVMSGPHAEDPCSLRTRVRIPENLGNYIGESHFRLKPGLPVIALESHREAGMAQKAPGKAHRKGLTLIQLGDLFPNDATAEAWFAEARWSDGPYCPHCGSHNVQEGIKHRSMTHRCRDCPDKRMFSLKTGTVMEGSKLGYRTWAIAIYLVTTNLKGVSSMKLHRDLGVTQRTAWHLAHRIRKSLETSEAPMAGPVEVDETHIGGKEKNKHGNKKLRAGRGAVGKTTVAGARDRATNTISAAIVESTDAASLQGFVASRAAEGAKVYTDQAAGYKGMPFDHEAVNHSISEYVRDQAHTNGIESFWAALKRGYHGTYHHMSAKHLDRYVGEFAGRHNDREFDTIDQMANIAQGMVGKRLRYADLTQGGAE